MSDVDEKNGRQNVLIEGTKKTVVDKPTNLWKFEGAVLEGNGIPKPKDLQLCAICCIPLPIEQEHRAYKECCGETIFVGCIDQDQNDCSAFCRTSPASDEAAYVTRFKFRVEKKYAEMIQMK